MLRDNPSTKLPYAGYAQCCLILTGELANKLERLEGGLGERQRERESAGEREARSSWEYIIKSVSSFDVSALLSRDD